MKEKMRKSIALLFEGSYWMQYRTSLVNDKPIPPSDLDGMFCEPS